MHSIWLVIDALCTPPTVEALENRVVFPYGEQQDACYFNPKKTVTMRSFMGRVSTFEVKFNYKITAVCFARRYVVTRSPAILSDENPLFEVQAVWPFSYVDLRPRGC
jgi:hypothetical protein